MIPRTMTLDELRGLYPPRRDMEVGRYESFRFIVTPATELARVTVPKASALRDEQHKRPLKRAVLGPKRARWT